MFYYLDNYKTYINFLNITSISPADNEGFFKVKMTDGDLYIVPDIEAYRIRIYAASYNR